MPREKRAAVCPECGKSVQVYVPSKGDGSVDVFRRHTNQLTRKRCAGSRREVGVHRRIR